METRARAPLHLSYRAVGSSTGQKEFVGDANSNYESYNHFGAGDIPVTAAHYSTLQSQSPPKAMVHIPFALGAIGVFHSVPSGNLGGASLALDACLLARIFNGNIRTWDHADIKSQNPGLNVPAGQAIKVAHRRLGSSSTGGLSGYLNKKCPGDWGLGAGSTINWPSVSTIQAVEGSPEMQAHINGNDYAIGYLDAGHGHDYNLQEVALTNRDGQKRTSKQSIALGGVADAGSAGVTANVFPADPSGDWSGVNLYDMAGANTWPIVLVSYLYVKKDQTQTNPKTAAALQAFIKMVIDNSDGLCQQFGFTVPSTSLKAKATSAASSISYPLTMQPFTVESSTSAYSGMGSNVISVKRNSYDIYEDSVLRGEISDLKTRVATLQTRSGTPAPSPSGSGSQQQQQAVQDSDDGDSTVPLILSIVALAISVLACVPALLVLMR